MRLGRGALLLLLVLSSGCQRKQLGGVQLDVTVMGPVGACLVVTLEGTPARSVSFENLSASVVKHIAIAESATSGAELRLVSELHERGCTGKVLVSESRTVTATKPPERVAIALVVMDLDGDGYGAAPAGSDCGDEDPERYPGAPERCNGVDDDCDGEADEGLAMVQLYVDSDLDGVGSLDAGLGCMGSAGLVTVSGDCDDGDAGVGPAVIELCNGFDEDCDGEVDEGFFVDAGCNPGMLCAGRKACVGDGGAECVRVETPGPWFVDGDGDGVGALQQVDLACAQPRPGLTTTSGDCDDEDSFNTPGRAEICDQGKDNDCNASTVDACDGGWVSLPGNGAYVAHVTARDSGEADAVGDVSSVYRLQQSSAGISYAACNGSSSAGDGQLRALWFNSISGSLYIASNDVFRLDPDGGCPRIAQPSKRVYSMAGIGLPDGGAVIFASGSDRFYRLTDPPSSTEYLLPAGVTSDSLALVSSTELIFVGQIAGRPYISRWLDGGFVASGFDAGTSVGGLNTIHLNRSGRGWALGGNQDVWFYDGAIWNPMRLPSDAGVGMAIYGAWAFSDSSVYFVDASASVFRASREDAGTLRAERLFRDSSVGYLGSISGTAPNDIWVVGPLGRIFHFYDP